MERVVLIIAVLGAVAMVALDLLVFEPSLGSTYFFYLTVLVCVMAVLLIVWLLWRRSNRRRPAG